MFIFLVGCLDYQAYQALEEQNTTEEDNLLQEIAQIEDELALVEEEEEIEIEGFAEENLSEMEDENVSEVDEEGILPNLEEETEVLEIPTSVEDYDFKITVDENEIAKVNLKLNDPDEDKVTYTFSPPLDKNGTWKTNYGDAGEYLVTLTASDGKLTTKSIIKLIVNRVNVAPIIKSIKDIVAKEGDTIKLEPDVSDPNNDPVTLTITEPLNEGLFASDHTSAGEYQITVTASDGELESKQTVKLSIKDVNVLPVIDVVKNIKVKEGETIKIEPEVTDLDGDEINLTISEPVGNDGIWKTDYTDHGSYTITITANDGKDTVTEKVQITIEDVNKAPEIIDIYLG